MICENPKQKGLSRDKAILRAIEDYQALNTEQVKVMFFNDINYGQRKAQERLLKLHRAEKLQRKKIENVYTYWLDKQPGMIKHLIATNWVRIWVSKTLPSWEKLHSWNYEQDYKILRCDGFIAIKNAIKNSYRFMFLEMDRGTNAFDKVIKYNKLYESDKLNHWWWIRLTERFPPILVVTIDQQRKRLIQSEIEAQNYCGLEFQVKLLDEIKGEVMKR